MHIIADMQFQHKTCISAVFICLCCISLSRIVLIVMQVDHSRENQVTELLQKQTGALRSDYTTLVEDAPTRAQPSNTTDTDPERKAPGRNITTGSLNMKSLPRRTTENQISQHKTQFQRTIVTAYFRIKHKHSYEEYMQWMQNILSLKDAMVIYTTRDMVPIITSFRTHAWDRTKVIVTTLQDTTMATNYTDAFWAQQKTLDWAPKFHPSKEIYWIWNEKTEFLKRIVDQNPFKSEFFAWVDIGYMRSKKYNGKEMLLNIPADLKEDQVLMLDVSTLVNPPKHIGQNWVGGGFIGGYALGVIRWHKAYYNTLHENRNQFIGMDQPWMWRTCEKYKGLCQLVKPQPGNGNPWFYMAVYLSQSIVHSKKIQKPTPLETEQRKKAIKKINCMELVSRNMPIDKFGNVRVHHYEATGNNGKWNEKQRWNKMDLKFPCTILVCRCKHTRTGWPQITTRISMSYTHF